MQADGFRELLRKAQASDRTAVERLLAIVREHLAQSAEKFADFGQAAEPVESDDELLTGEPPFRGSPRMVIQQVLRDEPRPPRTLDDRILRDLETICLKAMAKEPNRRFQTAQQFADDLLRYLRGEPIHARRVSRAERTWRWCQRNPIIASLLTTVAALLGHAKPDRPPLARRDCASRKTHRPADRVSPQAY